MELRSQLVLSSFLLLHVCNDLIAFFLQFRCNFICYLIKECLSFRIVDDIFLQELSYFFRPNDWVLCVYGVRLKDEPIYCFIMPSKLERQNLLFLGHLPISCFWLSIHGSFLGICALDENFLKILSAKEFFFRWRGWCVLLHRATFLI